MSNSVWTAIGSFSLGLVVGWLIRTFLRQTPTLKLRAFATIVSIVGGGATLAVWRYSTGQSLLPEANMYFVGVLIAVIWLRFLQAMEF